MQRSQPLAIVLIGLPGSGKSTWARDFIAQQPQYQLISTDIIRAQLYGDEAAQGEWNQIWYQVQQRLREGLAQAGKSTAPPMGIVYDATNVRRRYRRRLLGTLKTLGYSTGGLWFDLPVACCLRRNQQRTRQVPEAVILRMGRQIQGARPAVAEGFDWLIRLCPPEQPV
ncbi:MAG: AAA family ATPase [Cyanobacteria bacterium P01_A01_bin.114]